MSIRHATRIEQAYSLLFETRRQAKRGARARRLTLHQIPGRRAPGDFVYWNSRPRRAFTWAPCSLAKHRLRAWGFSELPF